jgi:hypothetical protein
VAPALRSCLALLDDGAETGFPLIDESGNCPSLRRTRQDLSMITKRYIADLTVSALLAGLAWTCIWEPLINPATLIAQQQPKPKKSKSIVLTWNPPQVDWRLKSLIPEPPCILPSALGKASERANTMFDNLKRFTAREEIHFETVAYQPLSQEDIPLNDFAQSYDYIVSYKEATGGFVVQDSRTSRGRSLLQPAFNQDLGLTELALIFLPSMQADYEFKCEGTVKWNGEPTWVIRFQQCKDKPHRTISFRGKNGAYPASLLGRAWIATESGEIRHMETRLVDAMPEIKVRQWYFSINYSPVVFSANNVRISLPQMADVYVEFDGNRRTIANHTFTDFKLFSTTITLKP